MLCPHCKEKISKFILSAREINTYVVTTEGNVLNYEHESTVKSEPEAWLCPRCRREIGGIGSNYSKVLAILKGEK